MSIFYQTSLEKIPNNCFECSMTFCNLPLKAKSRDFEVKKEYTTKRHKACPLREIEDK